MFSDTRLRDWGFCVGNFSDHDSIGDFAQEIIQNFFDWGFCPGNTSDQCSDWGFCAGNISDQCFDWGFCAGNISELLRLINFNVLRHET